MTCNESPNGKEIEMIQIKPISPNQVEISQFGKLLGNPYQECLVDDEIMDTLHENYPGQTELILKGNGFRMTASPITKALELAGLDGFAAAKQQATGKVVF